MIPCTYHHGSKSFNLFSVKIFLAKKYSTEKKNISNQAKNGSLRIKRERERERYKKKKCWSINEFQLCYIIPFNRIVRFACHWVVHLFLSCSSIVYFQMNCMNLIPSCAFIISIFLLFVFFSLSFHNKVSWGAAAFWFLHNTCIK